MSTRVYIDNSVNATRYLDTIPYFPNDISLIPTLIPGMVLQFDVDMTVSNSLSRNRVGASMNVVGAPETTAYSVKLNENNYIDTEIDISRFNGSDLTIIGISKNPGGKFNIAGRLQTIAPQRTRALMFDDANYIGARWINNGGSALRNVQSIATSTRTADMYVAQFIEHGNGGFIALKVYTPATKNMTQVLGGASSTAIPSGNILLGASQDKGTSVTGEIYAVMIFSRVISDDEISLLYTYYKNHYAKKNIAI